MRRLLLFAAVSLLAISARADWIEYSTTDHGSTLYYDPSTIKSVGTYKKVWTLVNAGVENSNSYKKMTVLDCKNQTHANHYVVFYKEQNGSGEVVFSSNKTQPQEHIVPGSTMDALFKKVCRK